MTTDMRDNILRYVVGHPDPYATDAFADFDGLYRAFPMFPSEEIDKELYYLEKLEYLEILDTQSGIYVVGATPRGREHLDDKAAAESIAAKERADERKERERIERKQDIQIWVAIVISIAALIVSIVK